MDFLSGGFPFGSFKGIEVRVHFTLVLYGFALAAGQGNFMFGLAVVAGLYVCILLHEFGHALTARWCDGECDHILLWPLGGLAFCRPAFHPTAHLLTTLAGPLVSLLLWWMFWGLSLVLAQLPVPIIVTRFVVTMWMMNRWLFLFNMLIPAFPMDAGRTVRDILWHFMSAETATRIAVRLSQLVAAAAFAYAFLAWTGMASFPQIPLGPGSAAILGVFIFMQSHHESAVVGAEAMGTYQFSLRERWQRGSRRRAFHRGVAERRRVQESTAFHQCTRCGVTEKDDPSQEFRVCPDCSGGQEYCRVHLEAHSHV